MILKVFDLALYELFPFPRLLSANAIVSRGAPDADARKLRWTGLGRDRLLVLLAEEWERAKHLDDKLFKATTGLSVAVSAAGVASKTILDSLSSGALKIAIAVTLLYAIGSLFAGVIMGFKGLRPKQRPGYGPDFAVRIRAKSRTSAREVADALMHFEIKNLIVSNEATAANMAMRNGVIAFAIAMTFSLFIPPKAIAPPAAGDHFTTVFSTPQFPEQNAVSASKPSADAQDSKTASLSAESGTAQPQPTLQTPKGKP